MVLKIEIVQNMLYPDKVKDAIKKVEDLDYTSKYPIRKIKDHDIVLIAYDKDKLVGLLVYDNINKKIDMLYYKNSIVEEELIKKAHQKYRWVDKRAFNTKIATPPTFMNTTRGSKSVTAYMSKNLGRFKLPGSAVKHEEKTYRTKGLNKTNTNKSAIFKRGGMRRKTRKI